MLEAKPFHILGKKRSLTISLLLLAAWVLSASEARADTFNLRDFGAAGDGVTDDGPALQRALNALAAAGGGTLFVPAGRYAIITPVSRDFTGLASSLTILGVESSTPVDNTGPGSVLSQGLDLVSEFAPKTGEANTAVTISGLQNFLIEDIAFIGTPNITTDARVTLLLHLIEDATIRHCEFYCLISLASGGAIVLADRSRLKIEQSKFLGCTGNSALYTPVVQNLRWKSIAVTDSTFLDYGQRPELYGKTGMGTPISWINIGNAETVGNDSPRREVIIRNLFLDEGALAGIFGIPDHYPPPNAPIDLVYITGLRMNVSSLGSSGNYFSAAKAVFIEKSHYGLSNYAFAAINVRNVGTAILDQVECVANANRIYAHAATGRLTVIDSVYTFLDSQAQITEVINTDTGEEDPVQYVRQQYETVLDRELDPAGHFYWSDLIVRCGDDIQCAAAARAALRTYLSNSPSRSFSIAGQVTDENDAGVPDVTIALSGSQTVATQTDADGQYHFSSLPTSGHYTVVASKSSSTFSPPSLIFNTSAGDQTANFTASLKSEVPVLISEANSTRAIALDAVLQTREPFPLNYIYPWMAGKRTRLMLFAANFDLAPNETATAVTATAEASSLRFYPLAVEYVGKVPGFPWLNCIVVRVLDDMVDVGDVLISVTYRGNTSNRVHVGMGHIGGGPPDDPGSVPTPG